MVVIRVVKFRGGTAGFLSMSGFAGISGGFLMTRGCGSCWGISAVGAGTGAGAGAGVGVGIGEGVAFFWIFTMISSMILFFHSVFMMFSRLHNSSVVSSMNLMGSSLSDKDVKLLTFRL